jgi:hypothetical protein
MYPAGDRPTSGAQLSRINVLHPATKTRLSSAYVDGKTVRDSRGRGIQARHLLAALDHDHGVVLGQVDVNARLAALPRTHIPLAEDHSQTRTANGPHVSLRPGARPTLNVVLQRFRSFMALVGRYNAVRTIVTGPSL